MSSKSFRILPKPTGGGFTSGSTPTSLSGKTCGGSKPNCTSDQKVYLSLRAYPVVVRQVGDIVNFYFKITNLTDKTITGPIDFFISGADQAIATIDSLPALDYYDLLITGTVDEQDVAKKFIVATVWARLRSSTCLLGNVAESEVSVDTVVASDSALQFANPLLLIDATETSLDVQVGVDIINLSSLVVDSLTIDLSVIFGKDTELSYLVNGVSSTLFTVTGGVLSLAEGQTIGANQRIALLVTNADKTINLDGFCSQSCQSTASWRFVGESTNNTSLEWEGTSSTMPLSEENSINPLRLSILKWAPYRGLTFFAGGNPYGLCYDGNSIWVTVGDHTVNKINPISGLITTTYTVGNLPRALCYDGSSIWVANVNSGTVNKIDIISGVVTGPYNSGATPYEICSDGGNIWVTNYASSTVTKINGSDGTIIGAYDVGVLPRGICFDGNNIWVVSQGGNNVFKINPDNGTIIGIYDVGRTPSGVCFDGGSIWVTNNGAKTVTKLNARDGAVIGTYSAGSNPSSICFDGSSIWVANVFPNDNTVTEIKGNDGVIMGSYHIDGSPYGICFDGSSVWVANSTGSTVNKI